MFYNGYPTKGACTAGSGHDAQGYHFILPHDISGTGNAQNTWAFCEKCHVLFYDGYPQKGSCGSGGGHQAQGYNFVLPHDLPGTLDFDFNPIVFGGGVPVGGSAHLTIRQDGSYTFTGHFHDSGGTEYKMGLVWAVKDSQNIVYTFQHSGHVSGTFEPGSRNDDWTVDSRNDDIASRWANTAAGSTAHGRAHANIDIINLTNSLIGTIGTVLGVVAIMAA